MTIEKQLRGSVATCLSIMLLGCTLLNPAIGQTVQANQSKPGSARQLRPVSLAHLYWHFLVYLNRLDTKAAEFSAQGKDSSLMHNHLKKQLGFSDHDFEPIRTSSIRLTAEIKALDAQAATIQTEAASAERRSQLHTLTLKRETDIQAEISYLKQALPPPQISRFEAFLVQFFSPANAVIRPTFSGGQTPTAVQR
jgi:hypothetical protein